MRRFIRPLKAATTMLLAAAMAISTVPTQALAEAAPTAQET